MSNRHFLLKSILKWYTTTWYNKNKFKLIFNSIKQRFGTIESAGTETYLTTTIPTMEGKLINTWSSADTKRWIMATYTYNGDRKTFDPHCRKELNTLGDAHEKALPHIPSNILLLVAGHKEKI